MKVFLRLIISFGAVALLLFVTSYLLQNQILKIQSVDLTLAENNNETELFLRIRKNIEPHLKKLKGQYLWKVSLNSLMTEIEKDQRVSAVQIFRSFPNQLKIEINPHHPVVMLYHQSQKLYPVAHDGSLLEPLALTEASNLPILRGKNFWQNVNLRQKSIEMLQALPDEGLLTIREVSEISYYRKQGFKLTLVDSGTNVKLGLEQFAFKASLVERVLKYLQSQQLQGRVIDARFDKKVVVRLRNAP